MCRSKSIKAINKELEDRFNAIFKEDYQYQPIYVENGYQHLETPILTSDEPGIIQGGRWGLIPAGIKDSVRAKEFSNSNLIARSETIFDKFSFKRSIIPKRCLILVTGFFETMHFQREKYPYHISLKNEYIYCIAGIYSKWKDPITEEIKLTYAMITVPANETLKRIHNHGDNKHRMPVLLERNDEHSWLNPALEKQEVIALMKTCKDELLDTYTVTKEVNQPTPRNLPSDLKPHEYPELAFLDL
jgi:putative SOS response-associated peptidase YedK